MNNTILIQLSKSIESLVKELDTTHALTQDEHVFMRKHLIQFCINACEKYINGKREHGGSLLNRHCLFEAQKEITDLLWYLAAETERQNKQAQNSKL